MKAHFFAAMTAVFMLCSAAMAQDYHIRTDHHTNLRASYSLSARIVETAAPGTALHVIGRNNRWLQINRNGIEVWMAEWVGHTRIDTGGQTSSQTGTTAKIDNCCFVDRQCNSDREWTDGYWAFQNGQCAAPAQSQSGDLYADSGYQQRVKLTTAVTLIGNAIADQEWIHGYWAYQSNQCAAPAQSQSGASTQPASNEADSINNCCFTGWLCNSDQQWTDGYWAFQSNQCDAPPGSRTPSTNTDSCCQLGWNCTTSWDEIMGKWTYEANGGLCNTPIQESVDGVIIEGSATFIAAMRRGLDRIRRTSPEWYAYSTSVAIKIREAWGEMGSGTLGRTFNLEIHFASVPVYYLAAVIVHENCHLQRWRNGVSTIEIEHLAEEAVCDTVAINALKVIAPGTGYTRSRIDEFLSLGLDYDLNAGAQREWERARHIYSQTN